MLVPILLVRREAATIEDPSVDRGMERLHAAAEELGEAGHFGDVAHRDASLPERDGGAARGEDLDAVPREAVRELDQAGLVGDREECPADPDRCHLAAPAPVMSARASSYRRPAFSTTASGSCGGGGLWSHPTESR